jgi:hypothetical protein
VIRIGVQHLRGAERGHLPGTSHLRTESAPEIRIGGKGFVDDLQRHAPP